MRREVMLRAVDRIRTDIEQCGVKDIVQTTIESQRKNNGQKGSSPSAFAVFKAYSIATADYGLVEQEICEILGIAVLLNPETWSLIADPTQSVSLMSLYRQLAFTTEQLPKILSLLRQDYVTEIKSGNGTVPEVLQGKTIVSVLMPEAENEFSSPKRLTAALESISDLYSVVAILENSSESELIVLACDSGSDKSFDFLGIAKVIEQVKEIIISLWDRVVFHRHKNVGESLALIAESLPILERIHNLKEEKAIEPEQAELLKRKVISGATKFLDAGLVIPELDIHSSHQPKNLMKPVVKLLAAPTQALPEEPTPAIGSTHVPTDEFSNLSPDEIERLRNLLGKGAGSNETEQSS